MKKNTSNNIRLGLFIVVGTIAMVIALYIVGSNKNIFSHTIKISSQFYNVNGLVAGNNVRYAGIDIGTVDRVRIENDSSVTVYMIIESKNSKYIKKNSIASVGTDGLMGNKLVNINPGSGDSGNIENGDMLLSLKPVENDEMVRTLNTTNENLAVITGDLRKFTSRLNKDKGILKFIEDSVSAENIRMALLAIRDASINANRITIQLNQLAAGLNSGEGLAGVLLKDTTIAIELQNTISNLEKVSDSLNFVVAGLAKFASGVNNPDGLVYTVSNDTTLTANVKTGMKNLEETTVLLNENLKAMRSSFLFKKYFKNQEKEQKKSN
jgi:phospholipid/cholesterol/gamma-HCH transport system substrate-binding protein